MLCLFVCMWLSGALAQEAPLETQDYVITLNSTDKATVYCFSDYLGSLKLETEECAVCKGNKRRNKTAGGVAGTCKEECAERGRKCPKTPAEHAICMTKIYAGPTARKLICTGTTSYGAKLVVNITVVHHEGARTCYGESSGVQLDQELIGSRERMNVTYNTPILCINSSLAEQLDAGHLLAAGYTIVRKLKNVVHDEHAEDKPEFDHFCKVEQPKLWKWKQGAVFQCNGSLHVLQDQFPCLQFSPFSSGFVLPSLENCSTGQMVGIVVAMIVAMVMCYTILIACIRIWGAFCRCAKKEVEELPLAQADSSQGSRLTNVGGMVQQRSRDSMTSGRSGVVKQQSRDSMLSNEPVQSVPETSEKTAEKT